MKSFLIIDKKTDSVQNVPQCVKQHIHKEDVHTNNDAMRYNIAIPYVDNTLKKIHVSYDFYNKFTSTFYNDKGFTFVYLFME